jgi:CheY-like chemotaxis protein
MPKISGIELCKKIKESSRRRLTPPTSHTTGLTHVSGGFN